MTVLQIQLSLAQGNLILEGLSERPFKQVFALIGDLNQQAAQVFPENCEADYCAQLHLSAAHLRLIIEALGELPFNRVHILMQHLHQQLQLQLQLQQQTHQHAHYALHEAKAS
jgi:hypothetical protein